MLQEAACRLRSTLSLRLSTPLIAALSAGDDGEESPGVYLAVSTTREDRRVRVVFGGKAGRRVVPDATADDFRGTAVELRLPKKTRFPTDSDSEAEAEAIQMKVEQAR